MIPPGLRFTLAQRAIYSAWLEYGLRPVTVYDLAVDVRIHPRSVRGTCVRAQRNGWCVSGWTPHPEGFRDLRTFTLTEEGVIAFKTLLARPRYPET